MSRRLKIVLAIVALVVVAGAVAFFLLRGQGSGPEIDTATATVTTLGVNVTASGQLTEGVHADVYPPTQGTLSAVYVKNGQSVKAGQKIAQMDTGPLKIQVQQAKAGLAQANAQLDAANQQTPSGQDVAAAQAGVNAASAAHSSSKTVYNNSVAAYNNAVSAYNAAVRAAELSPTPAAQAAVNQANAAKIQASSGKAQADASVDQTYAALKQAQAQLAKLNNTSTSAARSAAEASAAQARQALAVAQATLAEATMKAPVAGVVIFNPVGTPTSAAGGAPVASAGVAVSPASAPFTVVDLGASVFTAQVDEADVSRVAPGMAANVTLDAFSGKEFASRVVSIGKAAQATATGGTIFPVDLEMTDAGEDLLLGMKGDASIEVSAVSQAVVIPVEALFNENGKNYVYLVQSGKLKKQEISVGATTETQVQVLKGLSEGDVVALSGPTQYTDGMSVRVNP